MADMRAGTIAQGQFFSPKNEAMLDRLLYSDFQRRVGADLSDKQKARLQKTIRHYMTEVYSKNPSEPVQLLNKEVLTAVVPDFMGYLRRAAGPTVAEDGGEGSLRMDVGSRFDQLQAERQGAGLNTPAAPDFRIALEESGPTALSRFEEIKRAREAEAQREAETAVAMRAATTANSGIVLTPVSADIPAPPTRPGTSQFLESDVDFRNGIDAAKARDQLALIMRDAERMMSARNEIIPTQQGPLPDPRKILLGDSPMSMLPPRAQGIASANPTLALPDLPRERPVLPQDILKPQEDIVSYKEVENNLFIYSADRDWIANNSENRYNFSVNFDPANNRTGFNFSPATNIKFKNIVRIEFVKAILPAEACNPLVRSTASSGSAPTFSTGLNMSIFSFPYLQVRIPELNSNGYGTNDGINNAFAAISYEAYWTADSNANNRGYTRMIPKFLKCQKVFYPTPLATLQKLTFEIQQPNGQLVCDSKDTLDVSGIFTSLNVTPFGGLTVTQFNAGSTSFYRDSSGQYLFIASKTYFNRWAFAQGDRIQLKNIDFPAALKTAAGGMATQDMINFLTRDEGHTIVDIGTIALNTTWVANNYADNSLGFANMIVIRSMFGKRSNESPYLMPWGGTAAADATFQDELRNAPSVSSGRLINLNHQVQIILRVITREMDAATKLRPDNLQA